LATKREMYLQVQENVAQETCPLLNDILKQIQLARNVLASGSTDITYVTECLYVEDILEEVRTANLMLRNEIVRLMIENQSMEDKISEMECVFSKH